MRGTWLLLEACRTDGRVERVVVAASDKAYGPQDALPYREDFALQPRYPYDASKAAADLITRSYWHTYGLPVAITRFANLYGGGDANTSRLIPEAVSAALAGRRPVIRSDGKRRARLPLRRGRRARPTWRSPCARRRGGARGEAFNAGSGRPWSVREVVELVCEAAGTRRRARHPRHGHAGRGDRPPVRRRDQAPRGHGVGAGGGGCDGLGRATGPWSGTGPTLRALIRERGRRSLVRRAVARPAAAAALAAQRARGPDARRTTRFEVIVAHDAGDETEALLREHPLAAPACCATSASRPAPGPARQAQRGVARARARRWSRSPTTTAARRATGWPTLLAAARAAPGAVVQGATRPDPDERNLLLTRRPRADPERRRRPTRGRRPATSSIRARCSSALGGFDEACRSPAGEDTDLRAARPRRRRAARRRARRADLPRRRPGSAWPRRCATPGAGSTCRYVARAPSRDPPGGAAPAVLEARARGDPARARRAARCPPRHRLAALLALPWARLRLPPYGGSRRGRLRAVAELPGRAAEDVVGVAALARGSVRYRTLFLLAVLPAARDRIASSVGDDDLVLDVGGWASRSRAPTGSSTSSPTRPAASTATAPPRAPSASLPRPGSCATSATGSPGRPRRPVRVRDLRAHARGRARPGLGLRGAQRVARAGYVEVPSRLEEQALGVQGPWVGWSHHRWLIDLEDGGLAFAPKSQLLDHRAAYRFPVGFHATLSPKQWVTARWWEGALTARERFFADPAAYDAYLREFVAAHRPRRIPARPWVAAHRRLARERWNLRRRLDFHRRWRT